MSKHHRLPILLAAFAVAWGLPARASDPASHDVTVPTAAGQTVVVEWTGTVQPGTNPANLCPGGGQPIEDGHLINLTVPEGAYDAINVTADFHIEWDDAGQDLILTVRKDGVEVDSSDGGEPQENVSATNPAAGEFEAAACGFIATAPTPYRGRLTLTGRGAAAVPLINEPAPLVAGMPRFLQMESPGGIGDDTSGEMNVGFSPATGRFLALASLQTMRITMPEDLDDETEPPLKRPESCPALWEDVSFPTTTASTNDPILSTDRVTGRTFVSQLAQPPGNSVYAFSDDDGETWIQGTSTTNGALDHQSIWSAPYHAPGGPLPTGGGYPHAVHYCSQSLPNGFLNCVRSDDGGLTFGPPVIAVDSQTDCTEGFQFIHGHIRNTPDGTILIPVNNCNGKQFIAVSEDNGDSWEVRPNTSEAATPPNGLMHSALAPSLDGSTLYHCYLNADGQVRASVSRDMARTWTDDQDLGAQVGLAQGVFTAASSGDPDRATCGFLGTTTPGNYAALDFPGIWYVYMASTFDGGRTWRTVIASPGNVVQGVGGICTLGTIPCLAPAHRNLLDFNEMDMDERGYPLYAYDDGCVGLCDVNPVEAVTYVAKAALTRQIGGRGLLSAFDPVEPALPHRACLTGSRTKVAATLTWRTPDSGGAEITGYKVFRGTSAGALAPIGTTGKNPVFVDATADADTEYVYKVSALNSVGESQPSNLVTLPPSDALPETPCALPGITLMQDGTGDAQNMQPQYDLEQVRGAEPLDLPGKVALLIKVVDLAVVPPNTLWAVRFKAPTGPANGDSHYFVGMSTQNGITRFVHGTSRLESAVATSVTVFEIAGDIDPASSVNPDGTITLIADKALFGGLPPGAFIADMTATTRPTPQTAGPIAAGAQDDIAGGGYQMVAEGFCAAGGGPPVPPVDPPGGNADGGRFGGALGLPLLLLALYAARRSKQTARSTRAPRAR